MSSRSPQSKRKGVGQPKGAVSSYLFFCNAKRAEVKAAHPEKTTTELSSVFGALWQATTAAERVPFAVAAAKDRERYVRAMASYVYVAPPTKKRKMDPCAPKGSRSSYILFCKANRTQVTAANPDWSATEVTKALGAAWSALDDEAKAPFKAAALADRARYKAARVAWAASTPTVETL